MIRSALSAAALQRGGTIPTICACCGERFDARTVHTAYCGVNCRRRAYYYRRLGRPIPAKDASASNWTQPIRPTVVQPEIMPAAPAALDVRQWQGTPIERRAADNYVNATAMCNANGRRWAKYAESERCREYLQALAQRSGFRTIDLIEARPGRGGGTFVHPSLAIDLARWISPAFAVWMDGWFLDSLAAPAIPIAAATHHLPEGVHVVAATRRRAAELWWQAIELDVHSTLARRFDPTHRTDAGLPERVGYRWHQLSLPT